MKVLITLTTALALGLGAPASAASIKGTWKGTISYVKGGSGSFPLIMKINATHVGRKSGKIQIPGAPCRGPITLERRKGPKYFFQYRENSGVKQCTGDDRVTVRLVGGMLRWKGVSPDGDIVGKGTLRRQ